MRKEELQQIRFLKREALLIKEQLENLPTVSDTVSGSSTQFPYTKHAIRVTGVDKTRSDQLKQRLSIKVTELQKELERLDCWIDSVHDSEMRMIMQFRYRNGMSWQTIAMRLGYADESVPRKRHNRFLNNSERTDLKNQQAKTESRIH